MFNKKLKRRVRALEEFFDIIYHAKEDKDDYSHHVPAEYGKTLELIKMLEWWRNKSKK